MAEEVIRWREFWLKAVVSLALSVSFVFLTLGAGARNDQVWWYLSGALGVVLGGSFLLFDQWFRRPIRWLFVLNMAWFAFVSLARFSLYDSPGKQLFFVISHGVVMFLAMLVLSPSLGDDHVRLSAITGVKGDREVKWLSRGLREELGQFLVLYTAFLTYWTAFGWIQLYSVGGWWILGVASLGVLGLLFHLFYLRRELNKTSLFFALVISLLLIEVAWVTSLWPINMLSRSLVVMIWLYFLVGVGQRLLDQHHGGVGQLSVRQHLSFSLVLLVAVMGLSKWTLFV